MVQSFLGDGLSISSWPRGARLFVVSLGGCDSGVYFPVANLSRKVASDSCVCRMSRLRGGVITVLCVE